MKKYKILTKALSIVQKEYTTLSNRGNASNNNSHQREGACDQKK